MAVTNFSVATSESWNDKTTGEKQEKTEWHRITVWGKLAELCNQYLSKGKQCYLEGRIETQTYDDKKTGEKKYSTGITASTVQFIGNKDENATPAAPPQPQGNDFAADDIPFLGIIKLCIHPTQKFLIRIN